MSRYIPFLDDPIPGSQPGGIDGNEKWWVERQEALEQAGYMLRPRLRPGWQPSWTGTNIQYLDCEDGQSIGVSVDTLSLTTCSFLLMLSATLRNGRDSYLRRKASDVENVTRRRRSPRT